MVVGLVRTRLDRILVGESGNAQLLLGELLLDLADNLVERLLRAGLEVCLAGVEENIAGDGQHECAVAVLDGDIGPEVDHGRWLGGGRGLNHHHCLNGRLDRRLLQVGEILLKPTTLLHLAVKGGAGFVELHGQLRVLLFQK